ncbi:MAG: hypothetical protein ACU88J_11255, partial [Gammaproteobacteria bacterium]
MNQHISMKNERDEFAGYQFYFKCSIRRSGSDSHHAILPDALRVNENLFQTEMAGIQKQRMASANHILVAWIPAVHTGMTSYFY